MLVQSRLVLQRRLAPYVLTCLQGTTRRDMGIFFVNTIYQFRFKLLLYVTAFDVQDNNTASGMVLSVDRQTCLIVIVLVVPGDGTSCRCPFDSFCIALLAFTFASLLSLLADSVIL